MGLKHSRIGHGLKQLLNFGLISENPSARAGVKPVRAEG